MAGDLTIRIRKPAVSGTFYPAKREELSATLDLCWKHRAVIGVPPPKAIIAPHAGYQYSGAVAASAYATWEPLAGQIQRVIVLGPSHRVALNGFAAPEAEIWQTPLGLVPIDVNVVSQLLQRGDVQRSDSAHEREHSLEVHLPFLQRVLKKLSIVPLVVGHAAPEQVASLLASVWGGPETLVVVSTDLSHYHPYAEAQRIDAETVSSIQNLDVAGLHPDRACGATAVAGLLHFAKARGMKLQVADVRNSADTVGDPERVVGYASCLLW